MKKPFELNLSPIWLLISALALTLPVFLPSSANPQYLFQDIIGMVTAAMYILSFPFGLLALPLMFLAKLFFGCQSADDRRNVYQCFSALRVGLCAIVLDCPATFAKQITISDFEPARRKIEFRTFGSRREQQPGISRFSRTNDGRKNYSRRRFKIKFLIFNQKYTKQHLRNPSCRFVFLCG